MKSSSVSEATQEGTVQVTPDKPINRLAAVDLYRGLACTSMIIAHTQNLLLLAPQSFLDFQWYTGPPNASGCPPSQATTVLCHANTMC